jgi:hypothetical protein
MAKKNNPSQKTSDVKVAEITSKGTITTAFLSFLGVVIVAVLGYFGSRTSSPAAVIASPSPTVSITNTPFVVTERYEVTSTKSWQRALTVQEGDLISIKYITGTWTNNKFYSGEDASPPEYRRPYIDSIGYDFKKYEGLISGANLAALIGRVGVDKLFEVGLQYEFVSPISGDLEFQMNDDKMSDNDGSILIEVTVSR